jgi:hypothetical protein
MNTVEELNDNSSGENIETTEDYSDNERGNETQQKYLEKDNSSQNQEKKKKEIKRGSKFRKSLLNEIPYITYADNLKSTTLNLKSWLDPILDIKINDFLNLIENLIPKKQK